MTRRHATLLLFVAALVACADARRATPIVERNARDPLRCEVTAELRDFGLEPDNPRDTSRSAVQLENGDLWLSEEVEGESAATRRLIVRNVRVSGAPNVGQIVIEAVGATIGRRKMVALPRGGFALLWLRTDRALWFAAFDRAGTRTQGPKQVEGVHVSGTALDARASRAGNIGVMFGGENGTRQLVTLDPAGDPLGPAHEVLQSVEALEAAPDGGFALLGADAPAARDGSAELLLMTTNEAGEPRGAAVRVATMSHGRTFWGAALGWHEHGYLVGWSEARHPVGDTPWLHSTGSYSVIMIQRVDRDGIRRGVPVPLRAAQDSVADRRPVLARFADAIAVFWSTGAYQYDCEMAEACSHRDRGQLVLIDPVDLAPRSELLEILRDPSYPNGRAEPRLGDLLGTRLGVRESEILITARLEDDDDTRVAPGFGLVRCE